MDEASRGLEQRRDEPGTPATPPASSRLEERRDDQALAVVDLATYVRHVRARLRAKKDCLTLITGKPGEGKSHLAYLLARLVDPTFTEEHMVFSGEVFIRLCESRPKWSSVVWDEIVEGGLSIEAVSGENRRVLKHLVTGRSLNQAMFACAPKLKLFQTYTKDDRAHWWIHVERRGVALFHQVVDNNPYPNGKPFYAQRFRRVDLPPMSPDVEARYERRKEEWRTRWHRDSKRYVRAMNARDQEAEAVKQLVKSLSWLPPAVRTFEDTFPGHKGKLRPWEEQVKRHVDARLSARRRTT